TARGRALGRGQIHRADYLYADEDPNATQTLNVDYQTLPDTLLGLIPKSIVWKLMQPVMNNVGLLAVNSAKFWASRTIGDQQ
ncbi:MAG: FAD-binding protein, partial [Planctomycetales bacterium]|nr:FAD-binding protein [Planctomycetales bacterium]NIP69661.1 FAD-binding protein [Planctomycetales bacterium]